MSLKVKSALVSIDWFYENLENKHLVILDATIPKVAEKQDHIVPKTKIKGAIFFDVKNEFSDINSVYPNTVLPPLEFEQKAKELGINTNSCIVVYDDLGIYSSPRVWWMFHLMGFKNIAVLNGGMPLWKSKGYPTETPRNKVQDMGNFKVDYHFEKIKHTKDIFKNISSQEALIVDARSKERFLGVVSEPRKEVEVGHIPDSKNLPYTEVIENHFFKSKKSLLQIYSNLNKSNKPFVFSCGSGITASILALGAEIAGYSNYAIYDGSWTEWGSSNLPIEK